MREIQSRVLSKGSALPKEARSTSSMSALPCRILPRGAPMYSRTHQKHASLKRITVHLTHLDASPIDSSRSIWNRQWPRRRLWRWRWNARWTCTARTLRHANRDWNWSRRTNRRAIANRGARRCGIHGQSKETQQCIRSAALARSARRWTWLAKGSFGSALLQVRRDGSFRECVHRNQRARTSRWRRTRLRGSSSTAERETILRIK